MSAKSLDREQRFRSRTVAFRVSPEEWDLIERKVALSGMKKQDYIINTLLDKTITAVPTPYVIHSIRKELQRFLELYGTEISQEGTEMMIWIANVIRRFDEEEKAKANTDEEPRQ